jgi:YbbR domain-containing protein
VARRVAVLKSNKLNVLISIVAALVIWTYVSMAINPPTTKTFRGVPVELVNMETLADRGLTVDKSLAYTVDIEVRGTRSEINEIDNSQFKATADLTGYPKGVNSVKVNVTVPNGVEWLQTKPENINVAIEDLVEVTKPVQVSYEDDFPSDVEPGFISVTPEEIEVAGTEAAVESIDHINISVPKGALSEEAKTVAIEPIAVDRNGEPSYNVALSSEVVELTATLLKIKEVPLTVETVGESPENVEVTQIDVPKTVTIKGTAATLEKITSLTAAPINLAEITGTVEIKLKVNLPENVELAGSNNNFSATVTVQGLAKKDFTFKAGEIEVEGLFEGLSGHVNTDSVLVTVIAEESIISDLKQEDIVLYVDAAAITESAESIEMELQYRITEGKEVKSIVFEPVKVRVTIIG